MEQSTCCINLFDGILYFSKIPIGKNENLFMAIDTKLFIGRHRKFN